jgi:hypothetical protein
VWRWRALADGAGLALADDFGPAELSAWPGRTDRRQDLRAARSEDDHQT